MKGLFIKGNDKCIEKVSKAVEELSLIAKGDGTEIMFQKISENTMIYICPGDNKDLMEFAYLVEGTMSYEEDGKITLLHEGDYVYAHGLEEKVYFKATTEVKLLYVSTQPVFHGLSNKIKELNRIGIEVQKKDPYTSDHDRRLSDLAMRTGNELGIPSAKLEILYYAALYHDLGKVNVPDEILNKPDKLTKEEFEIIKKHPIDSKMLLDDTFLKDAGEIVVQHHERPDGSGYPYGLKGDEISIEAKIIAVVDSYDAMTSDRPYRKATSSELAVEDLRRLSGIWYDPKVLEAFEKVLKEEEA